MRTYTSVVSASLLFAAMAVSSQSVDAKFRHSAQSPLTQELAGSPGQNTGLIAHRGSGRRDLTGQVPSADRKTLS